MTNAVSGMPRASLMEDGSLVQLEFITEAGPIVLSFDPDQLEQFASRALEVIREAQNRKRAKAGHAGVHAARVVAVAAQELTGSGKVGLLLRGTNGIVQTFAMSIEQSADLRPMLRKAEGRAKAEAAASRQ